MEPFLTAMSSSRSLVVGWCVCQSVGPTPLWKRPKEHQMVTKACLPS